MFGVVIMAGLNGGGLGVDLDSDLPDFDFWSVECDSCRPRTPSKLISVVEPLVGLASTSWVLTDLEDFWPISSDLGGDEPSPTWLKTPGFAGDGVVGSLEPYDIPL